MSSGRILVIAPNPDFRKSLVFALETVGYVVTSHAGILGRHASRGYDCVILDHKATTGSRETVLSFCRTSHSVLLLAGEPQPWLSREVFGVVRTPLSGDRLTEAVSLAVDAAPPAPHLTR